jgi:hypothetical protein
VEHLQLRDGICVRSRPHDQAGETSEQRRRARECRGPLAAAAGVEGTNVGADDASAATAAGGRDMHARGVPHEELRQRCGQGRALRGGLENSGPGKTTGDDRCACAAAAVLQDAVCPADRVTAGLCRHLRALVLIIH